MIFMKKKWRICKDHFYEKSKKDTTARLDMMPMKILFMLNVLKSQRHTEMFSNLIHRLCTLVSEDDRSVNEEETSIYHDNRQTQSGIIFHSIGFGYTFC